jgi:CRISPR/Cas system-associated exonuclease Cas4 (RecB family)
MDPLERGALMHEVQFETLSGLRDAGHLHLTPQALEAAYALLEDCVRRAAERYRERLAPAIARVFDDAIDALHADLKRWLERATQDAWQPRHFELSFGATRREQADRDSREAPVALPDGSLLSGSIDLVEAHGDRLRATDHKSGKPHAPRELLIGGGAHLQPLLYALALEALFPGREVVAGRLYYCTSDGGFEQRSVALTEQAREHARGVLKTIDQALADGFLPAAPAEGACAQCHYQPVCGPYEEQRIASKDPARLKPLQILRQLP